jgi:hypothetical protein
MNRPSRSGFTLVEAVIVAVVIAVILAVTIPWLRERERERLQVIADTEPWEVFEFRAMPAKESFLKGNHIVVSCEIQNMTTSPLRLPKPLKRLLLAFEGTNMYFRMADPPPYPMIPETAIAPGEAVRFDLEVYCDVAGTFELRVVYWNGERNLVLINLAAILPEIRFQSNAFRVVVEANDDSDSIDF